MTTVLLHVIPVTFCVVILAVIGAFFAPPAADAVMRAIAWAVRATRPPVDADVAYVHSLAADWDGDGVDFDALDRELWPR